MITYYPDQKGLFTFYKQQQNIQIKNVQSQIIQQKSKKKHKKNKNQLSSKSKICQISNEQVCQETKKSNILLATPKYYSFLKSVIYQKSKNKISKVHTEQDHILFKQQQNIKNSQSSQLEPHIKQNRYQKIYTEPNNNLRIDITSLQIPDSNNLDQKQKIREILKTQISSAKQKEIFRILSKQFHKDLKKNTKLQQKISQTEEVKQKNQILRLDTIHQLKLPQLNLYQPKTKKVLRHKPQSSQLSHKNLHYLKDKKLDDSIRNQKLDFLSKRINHKSVKQIKKQFQLNMIIQSYKKQHGTLIDNGDKYYQQDQKEWQQKKKLFLKKLKFKI